MEITLWHSVDTKSNKMRNVKVTREYWRPNKKYSFYNSVLHPYPCEGHKEKQRWQVDGSTIPPLSYQSPIGTMEVHNAFVQ